MSTNDDPRRIETLLAIMARLRAPGTGCPWDLEQTFATIAPYTLEEAYEVADAIERHDMVQLKDELGDLLFQVVFHSRMAEEAGAFSFADVVQQADPPPSACLWRAQSSGGRACVGQLGGDQGRGEG